MSTGPRRNSLKKKTRGKKSRDTVPLNPPQKESFCLEKVKYGQNKPKDSPDTQKKLHVAGTCRDAIYRRLNFHDAYCIKLERKFNFEPVFFI
jgi:hypothetical protein